MDDLIERLSEASASFRSCGRTEVADDLHAAAAELAILRREQAKLQRTLEEAKRPIGDWVPALVVHEAEARAEAAEKDAARYRWLRDDCDLSVRDVFGALCPQLNDGMDAAVDAELNRPAQPSEGS